MKLSDDRPFTPKSDRTSSRSPFYNLLRSPPLKVFEARSPSDNRSPDTGQAAIRRF
ncbi:hypothetical protein QT970_13825 [Microcoleus sp. herbarium8]|uniref:hypothetical protein n=1 Tax=Microcoleus sp. herbarium8 TaxID=3055436 RepID=UPI002FD6B422